MLMWHAGECEVESVTDYGSYTEVRNGEIRTKRTDSQHYLEELESMLLSFAKANSSHQLFNLQACRYRPSAIIGK